MSREAKLQDNSNTRVIAPAGNGLYTFVQPIGFALGKQIYEAEGKEISENYSQHEWFQPNVCHRGFGETGLHGSSFELNVLRNSELRKLGLRIGRPSEVKAIDKLGMLPSEFCTESGGICYNESNSNLDIAQIVSAEAKRRGWKLPVIASYNAFAHRNGKSGFEVYFAGDKEGVDLRKEVFTGDKANEFLEANFNFIINRGFQRLFRAQNGDWHANVAFRDSPKYAQVGFVFGEASQKDLTEVKRKEIKSRYGYDNKRRELWEMIAGIDREEGEKLAEFSKVFKN